MVRMPRVTRKGACCSGSPVSPPPLHPKGFVMAHTSDIERLWGDEDRCMLPRLGAL